MLYEVITPSGAAIQMYESQAWNVRLGSYFALGVDGVALAMLVLTAALTLVARNNFV